MQEYKLKCRNAQQGIVTPPQPPVNHVAVNIQQHHGSDDDDEGDDDGGED